MPILQYLFGVGGALLCLMFVLDAYVPKAAPREQHEIDRSTIRITARPTGDFVIDHFPAVRADLADAANDAVRKAMAMMPPEDTKQAVASAAVSGPAPPAIPRKRRVAQRPQHLANSDVLPPSPPQTWSNNSWSNNSWSNNGWSGRSPEQPRNSAANGSGNPNNSWSRGWSNSWSRGSGGNRWADNW